MMWCCPCGGLIIPSIGCNYCGGYKDMICYKDRGWCSKSYTCSNEGCPRMLGEVDQKNAEHVGLPIAFTDFSSECGKYEQK